MVRTQIQLTEQQARAVKAIAAAQGISVAEAIRRAIDTLTRSHSAGDTEERRRRALQIVGKFRSGRRDVSNRHDAYLMEAYDE
ncbi:MAG TPA: ribbon-helix-helix protein, CopG family [Syntrophobacteria bacterium]|nr:ribbon-helix-helix protein, CopG family [Syntrophobacteria bacterium]